MAGNTPPTMQMMNELMQMIATSRGTHGYWPDRPEMHAAFFVKGRNIARRELGVIDMRQIAPTFAAILGVIVQEGLENRAFLDARTTGFAALRETFSRVDVAAWSARAGSES